MGITVGLFLGVPWNMDFWLDLRGLINPKPNQPLPLMTPFKQFIGSIGQLHGSLINSDFESPQKKTSMSPVTQRYQELKTGSLEKRTAAAEFARGPGGMGGETGRGNRPGIWQRSKRRKNTGTFDVDWLQMLSELVGSGHF